ncbi:hypothetical protein AB1207_12415 [Kineococcus endophyticus]|uniref:Glycosyl transferase family 2 n=1 Tax=Kineococcus endophyticus TaxID=1181883 RepID=A0ABV3P7F6_9ACTN
MSPTRVLTASPVQQDPEILAAFLDNLILQETNGLVVDYAFVDDNHDARSSELLADFSSKHPNTTVVKVPPAQRYHRDENTHHWKDGLIWRVAEFKDALIDHARDGGYDHIFFVDSDIVLRPGTIGHLASLGKDIVSEVFWTSWQPGSPEWPQVWLRDSYDIVYRRRGEIISAHEEARRAQEFLDVLRIPGVYEVGGLGACTLLSREAMMRGVSFAEIPNLSLNGEDRHFCVRAMAVGLRLHADTHLPPLHLYRKSDLQRLPHFLAEAGVVAGV